MNERPLYCVITTIQEPTASVRLLAAACGKVNASIIVIGDQKGPSNYDLEFTDFYDLKAQTLSDFRLARLVPINSYARKNLGYLMAISKGAPCIYESDDDNAPSSDWQVRSLAVEAQEVNLRPWVNVYRYFSDELIWPRGFPLHLIRDPHTYDLARERAVVKVKAPIQQGLSDHSPDVDAIWRLLFDRELNYNRGPSIWLAPGSWCPLNTQSTWWWPIAYPLLYLPSYCSMRMTDIWRGFVAQRCLWELDYGLVFHAPEVIHNRNLHNLQRDLRDEIPGYAYNPAIVELLIEAKLQPGPTAVAGNLTHCYELLVGSGYIPKDELPLLNAWLEDLNELPIIKSNGI